MNEQPNTMQSTRSGDMQILTCSAMQGKNWVFNSWPLYQRNWPIWIILSLIFNFISIALTSMTFSVAISFIFQMGFIAGIYLSCKKTEAGEKLEIQTAFSAFNTNTKEIIFLGLIVFAMLFFVFCMSITPIIFVGGVSLVKLIFSNPQGQNSQELFASLGGDLIVAIILAILIFSIGFIFVIGAMIYAPILVVFEKLSISEALGLSLKANFKNVLSMSSALFWLLLISLPVMIFTFGFGFILLTPMYWGVLYLSYKDIFFIRSNASQQSQPQSLPETEVL